LITKENAMLRANEQKSEYSIIDKLEVDYQVDLNYEAKELLRRWHNK